MASPLTAPSAVLGSLGPQCFRSLEVVGLANNSLEGAVPGWALGLDRLDMINNNFEYETNAQLLVERVTWHAI